MGTSRATLRRWVGRLTGDLIVATATANGTTTTFVDTNQLVRENGHLAGRWLYVTSAALTGNAGSSARITANNKATATVTFTPALPNATVAGDVIEIWRDLGPTPEEVNDAINRAIDAASETTLEPARSTAVTFDADSPTVTIPAAWSHFAGAEWQDDLGRWREIPGADLKIDPIGSSVELRNRSKWLADAKSVRLLGYTAATQLTIDTDTTEVDAEWIVHQAASWLLVAVSIKHSPPTETLAKAQYLQTRADQLRPKTRVRPRGKFMRL